MRKTALILLLAWLGFAKPACAEPAPMVWRVCVGDQVILPYLSNEPANPGLAERLMVEAGRQAGLSVLLLRYPFKRCLAMSDLGEIDAMTLAPVAQNLQRFEFPLKDGVVDASRRLARLNLTLVRRGETQLDWDGQRFIGDDNRPVQPLVGSRSTLGVAKEALRAQGYVVDDLALTTKQAMAKLKGRRVDVVVGLQEEVELGLRDPNLDGLVVLQQPFMAAEFYAAVRKNLSPEQQLRVQAWWSAIGRLRDTPAYRPH